MLRLIMCKAIENSSPEQKALYLEAMSRITPHKAELIMPWVQSGRSIVDVGCADAAFTVWLTQKSIATLGIDISPEVVRQAKIEHPNVSFEVADVRDFSHITDQVICSSVLHEVYSYGNGIESVKQALTNIYKNLTRNGRLIIRDFIRPENASGQSVTLRHYKSDMVKGHTFYDFANVASHDYPEYRDYPVNMRIAYEFMFHKDYHENWETEIKETYGFWEFSQAKTLLTNCGFKIIHTAEMDNEWIVQNRLNGKIELMSGGRNIPYPKYQALFICEKA